MAVIFSKDPSNIYLRMLRDECTKDKFKLEYGQPEDFTRCFWQKQERVLPIWIAYRALLIIYFVVAVVVVFAFPDEGYIWYKNFLYYTYWSYFSEVAAFTLAFIVSVQRMRLEKKYPELPPMDIMPPLYKVLWCLYNIAAPCSVVLTTIFWLFVYSPEVYATMAYECITHIFNSVIIVIDFLLYAIPYRFFHFYMPLSFSIIYVLFSLVYQLSGGTANKGQIPIYVILDWRDIRAALSSCGVLLTCLIAVHFAFCVMHIVKHWKKKMREGEHT